MVATMYRRPKFDYVPLPLDGNPVLSPTSPAKVASIQKAVARKEDYKKIRAARIAVAQARAAPPPPDEEQLTWRDRNEMFNGWANSNKEMLDELGEDEFDRIQQAFWASPPTSSGLLPWRLDMKRLALEWSKGDRPKLDAERRHKEEMLRHWRLSPCPPRDGW